MDGSNFCSNDYLALSKHPDLASAVKEAIAASERVASTGSRLLSGHVQAWEELEEELGFDDGRSMLAAVGLAWDTGPRDEAEDVVWQLRHRGPQAALFRDHAHEYFLRMVLQGIEDEEGVYADIGQSGDPEWKDAMAGATVASLFPRTAALAPVHAARENKRMPVKVFPM